MTKARLALAAAATLAALGSVTAVPPAGAARDTSFQADISGQFTGFSGMVGQEWSAASIHAKYGAADLRLRSTGVAWLGNSVFPAGTKVGTSMDVASAGALGLTVPIGHNQASAPKGPASSSTGFPVLQLGGLLRAGLPRMYSTAAYGAPVLGAGRSGELASIGGSSASLDLLDLSRLGVPASVLPSLLRGPLVSVRASNLRGRLVSTLNPDGTHGLDAVGQGGLGDIHLLGGAANGGITLTLWSSDRALNTYVASARAWATGKPGGAGCSYVEPDIVSVRVGGSGAGFHAGIGQRIPLPGNTGWIDVEFTGLASCKAAADGTSAVVTGGGVGLRVHLQTPAGLGLADGVVSLPDLNHASVKVPAGGITTY